MAADRLAQERFSAKTSAGLRLFEQVDANGRLPFERSDWPPSAPENDGGGSE